MAITRFRQRSLAPRRYLSLLMLLLIPALIAAHRHSSVDFEHEQPQVIAYVDSGAAGPGSLGNSTDPYPSIFSAFFAGANEFRIKLGTYTESLAFGTGNHVFRTWNGSSVAEELDVPGQVTIAGTFVLGLLGVSTANLTLVGENVSFSIESIDIHDGVLDIGETTLVLNGVGLFNFLFIRDAGTLTSIPPPGKTPQQPGLLRFSGLSRDVQFDGLSKRIPPVNVGLSPGETLFLQADGSPDEERLIVEGELQIDSSRVELRDGLDILDVGQYEQFGGEFRMAGVSSINLQRQRFIARRNMIIEHGEFHANGGDVEVLGDYCLGCTPPETKNAQPRNGLFNLGILGKQTVVGNFTVGPDTDPSDGPDLVPELRNRYVLGGECGVLPDEGGLFVGGNYNFQGTGDRFDDLDWLPQEQGLRGNVFFIGAVEQFVRHRQDEDAFFCDVVMASRSDDNDGIELLSNIFQNDQGTLTLEHGIIDVGADSSDWIILNTGFERDLATRNNSDRGDGVFDLGSRDSYINGEVDRNVEFGNAGGGVITGGYLFAVGSEGEERDEGAPPNPRVIDVFRPLILQFPDDLGRSSLARVNYMGGCSFNPDPPPSPNPNKGGGGTPPILNTVSHLFWKLEFDVIPDQLPNIRLVADGLPGVNDITRLRIIQWDCDGTNARLAGTFLGDDPSSAMRVGEIDGVVNISQSGIEPQLCQVLGIASEHAINPIGPAPGVQNPLSLTKDFTDDPVQPGGTVALEFTITHSGTPASDATDIAFTDSLSLILPGLEATGLPANDICGSGSQISGTSDLTFTGGSLAANSSCTFDVTLEVPMGAMTGTSVNTTSDITSMVDNMTVTGGPATASLTVSGPPQADFSITKTADKAGVALDSLITFTITVTNNGPDAGSARVEDILPTNVDFSSSVGNCTEFFDVVTCTTGVLAMGQDEIFIVVVKATVNGATDNTASVTPVGPVVDPDTTNNSNSVAITTDVTDLAADLPTEFALLPNYPNPFNPSTTIEFVVPETGPMRLVVYDLLGKEVAVLVDEVISIGRHEVVFDARSLASGTYVYRMTASGFEQTRHLVLLK